MAPRYGTLSILDTLDTYNNTNVLAFGEEAMAGFLDLILAAYNDYVADMTAQLGVGNPPDRETVYGVNSTGGDMIEVDEFGLADAQKIPFSPSSVGFPLRKYQYTLQWTRDYLANVSPRELANQTLGIAEADERNFFNLIRRTLLKSTNNTAYLDRYTDNRNYTLRALVNADSQAIPPNQTSLTAFDASTHTHYLGTGSFVEANLLAAIETVREHGTDGGNIRVFINVAQKAAITAFSTYQAYGDPRLVYTLNATRAAGQIEDPLNLEDYAIGIIGPAEIWVKPWVPATYVIVSVVGGNRNPVLGWRRPEGANARYAGLTIAAELDRFPLHAQTMQRMAGISVWNRTRAAVLYTANATYASYTG